MPAAIPLIIMAASTATSAYSAHKQGQAADTAAGQQQSLMDRQASLAKEMMTLGKDQISGSKPALDMAMKHYMTLASGNRGAIDAELAPDRAAISNTQSGVQRNLMAHMGGGAQRDQAMARLGMQTQGQLGLLPFQARSDAVGKMAALGQNRMTAGSNFISNASNALSGQQSGINNLMNLNQLGNNAWSQFGETAFKTWGPYLMQMGNKGQKSPIPMQPDPWASGYVGGNF